jgi:Leucine-rich repeat (LRR) protein
MFCVGRLVASLVALGLLWSQSNVVLAQTGQDRDDASYFHEREILLALFEETGGLGWTDHTNWFQQSVSVCQWKGIICYADDDGDERRRQHIREINLEDNRLVGTVPLQVFELPYLQRFNVDDNADLDVDLTGLVLAQFLTHLSISDTKVSSLVGIGAAKALEVLHITDLNLRGTLPRELFELTNILALFANYNKFEGKLPTLIGMLSLLNEIYLYGSDLTGQIPTEIGMLSGIQILTLSQNAFGGTLPTQLNELTELKIIAIQREDDNEKGPGISGALPALTDLREITQLDLKNQKLSGFIPQDLLLSAPETELVNIDLTSNQFSGTVSNSLLDKKYLNLFLANNKITSVSERVYNYVDDTCPSIDNWMGGTTVTLGCDAFLCPPGTWAAEGRATPTDACETCTDDAILWGRIQCDSSTPNNVQERQVLVNLYNRMGGRYWKKDDNWLDFGQDVCTWFGITCASDGKVESIVLKNNGLTGSPPQELFDLLSLKTLNLNSNPISFDFAGISNAQKIESLDLSNADLSSSALGQISELALLPNLRFLNLASNNLDGSVPVLLFNVLALEELSISHNRFSGLLPSQVGKMSNLRRFGCVGNLFTGQLPTEMGNMRLLEELSASENKFGGTLPTELANLSNLRTLSLHQAGFSGGIAGPLLAFSNLQQLTSLQLDSNRLTGNLPSNFLVNTRRGDQRIEVRLSDNRLEGSVPSQWSRFDRLYLDLTENRISNIDASLCNNGDWMDGLVAQYDCDAILCPVGKYNALGRQSGSDAVCLNCPGGSFFGATDCASTGANVGDGSELDILNEFFFSTNGNDWKINTGWITSHDYCNDFHGVSCDAGGRVTSIELVDNGLSGTPATSIFKLPRLQELILSSNEIDFSFDGISTADNLNSLFLSNTGLASIEGIAGAPNLLKLHLADNGLRGEIPLELYFLTTLRELFLQSNQLSGQINDALSAMSYLESLFLYQNQYTGQIPAVLGKLTNLRELHLAENNFDGTIPTELNDLTNLRFLSIQREGGLGGFNDVGINQGDSSVLGAGLTGHVPAFDKLTEIQQLYLGVNSLSGQIPYNFLDGVRDKSVEIRIDLTSNLISGSLPGSLTQFDHLSLFVGGNRITDIADGICLKNNWMGGNVATFDCDGIMCPVGRYNTLGRKTGSATACQDCPTGTNGYMGSFECLTSDQQQDNSERTVLENMFKTMNGEDWFYRQNWMDRDESICTWYGIGCVSDDDESVVSIRLMTNGLEGNFPTDIWTLPNLQELNLQGNSIVMNFSGIGNAMKLEYLDLESCGISSLDGVQDGTGLQLLRLDDNALTEFPQEIFSLLNLQVLSLSVNLFPPQAVPTELQNFSNLVYFACSECGFTGSVPAWLDTFVDLEYLRLDQNAFDGTLPTQLENLMNLKHLDLADQISKGGGIRGGLLDFPFQSQLTEIFLQFNILDGPIPSNLLQSLTTDELVTIDLRFNVFTGAIPSDLTRINDLNLYVAANLIDELPDEICNTQWNEGLTQFHGCDAILCRSGTWNVYGRALENLECFQCDEANNQHLGQTTCGANFEHTILLLMYRTFDGPNWKRDQNWLQSEDHCTWEGISCHEDGQFEGLVKEIDLEDNNMSGDMSQWTPIWMLEGMTYINLGKNDISLSFSTVGNAINLDNIVLSETSTSSLVGIGGATSLKSLHITDAQLAGSLPDELYGLTNLEELFLSYNDITGTLATAIGMLRALRDLYLFGNKFQGTLPTELGILASIEHFSLGENQFTGTIPRQIMSLPFLQVLSLQNEEAGASGGTFSVGGDGLGGPLPAFDGLPRLRQLYLAHNSFTGAIPVHFLQGINDKSQQITVDLSSNILDGKIPKELADFDDMQLFLSGNSIHTIPDEICNKVNWMNGQVAAGCDAILCPPLTYNEFGRRVNSETPCQDCTYPGSALNYGSTECGPVLVDSFDDRSILFELYDATRGSEWSKSDNWKEDATSICNWYGVKCEPVGVSGSMTVTEIDLENNNLHGVIPSILLHLPALKKLNVGRNDVRMTFRAIGVAPALEELFLDETLVSNLDGIGQATSLKKLHLQKNSFGWRSIPDEIFEMMALTDLDLSDSRFGGTLSSQIGSLLNLQILLLNGNNLIGEIPDAIGDLTAVRDLILSNNNFYGTLPGSVSSLVSLESFMLDNSSRGTAGITGPLRSFATMPKLRELHLSDNQFTGSIPVDFLNGIDDSTEEINVYLQANHLVGTVPSSLSKFLKLNIELSDNLFTGIGDGLCDQSQWLGGTVGSYSCNAIMCPAGQFSDYGRQVSADSKCLICPGAENSPYFGVSTCVSLQKLREKEILELFYKSTGGESWKNTDGWLDSAVDICSWYGISCKQGSTVESILLGSNHITGTPPKEIFELKNLAFLWLYSNPMDFSFESIQNASNLRSLLLDSTGLKSLEGASRATSLVDFDVRFNQLQGKLPSDLNSLRRLQSFSCGDNRLTGTVPEFNGNPDLNALRLGNNRFTGTLPSFAGHTEMKSLDISNNMLEGSIPSVFLLMADTEASIFLDLSTNRLTGRIPSELSRFDDLTLYLRDNRIEGIDPSLCTKEDWNGGDVGNFQCDGILCPSGTFSSSGRASRSGATCEPCDKNKRFGSTTCGSSGSTNVRIGFLAALVTCALTILGLII